MKPIIFRIGKIFLFLTNHNTYCNETQRKQNKFKIGKFYFDYRVKP